jgi:GT2 family glycosyltransferase
MKVDMKIGAGIYHYRSWPEVRPTIDTLLAQTREPDQIVVLDHASGDGSAELIREAYPQIEVVEAPDNRGQVAGENRIRNLLLERDFDAVYVSPDDLELAPDALELMVARLEEDPQVGAVGPIVAKPAERDRLFYAGGHIREHDWSLEFRGRNDPLSDWVDKGPLPVDFLQTGGMIVRSDVARQVGDMYEGFYYWAEDVDYTLRINQAGWRVECLPNAVAWEHFNDAPPYIATRNILLLTARHATKRLVARQLVRQLYWIARDSVQHPSGPEGRGKPWPRFRGVVDFCRRRWGAPPEGLRP